jgi:hypothetical protein
MRFKIGDVIWHTYRHEGEFRIAYRVLGYEPKFDQVTLEVLEWPQEVDVVRKIGEICDYRYAGDIEEVWRSLESTRG